MYDRACCFRGFGSYIPSPPWAWIQHVPQMTVRWPLGGGSMKLVFRVGCYVLGVVELVYDHACSFGGFRSFIPSPPWPLTHLRRNMTKMQ